MIKNSTSVHLTKNENKILFYRKYELPYRNHTDKLLLLMNLAKSSVQSQNWGKMNSHKNT